MNFKFRFIVSSLVVFSITIFAFAFANSKKTQTNDSKSKIIIDSKLSFEEAIKGTKAPKELIDSLRLIDVKYYSSDKNIHQGQIVVNQAVVDDVKDFFELAFKLKFTINKVIPISKYNWDDDASMEDNNSSAFNYRYVANTTRLSNHSFGRAIDINPQWNPVFYQDGKFSPANGKRNTKRNGTFTKEHPLVKLMIDKGWRYGGNWTSPVDNHHFDKR